MNRAGEKLLTKNNNRCYLYGEVIMIELEYFRKHENPLYPILVGHLSNFR
jgi:hypothetical protein